MFFQLFFHLTTRFPANIIPCAGDKSAISAELPGRGSKNKRKACSPMDFAFYGISAKSKTINREMSP
jgi:hypothetical protein